MTDLSSQTPAAEGAGPRIVVGAFDHVALEKATRRAVTRALSEDLGDRGDLTSRATVPASLLGEAEVIAREAGVVSGLAAMVDAFTAVDARTTVELHVDAGQPVIADQVIATVRGPVRGILAAERTALNFLGHLSGIATATANLQELVADTGCTIRDTRKTTPGLRLLEKAAVLDGGGGNHRIGLYDAILVKDNHILAAGGVAEAVASLRAKNPDVAVQVEVEDVDQLRELLDLGITDILLDNFTVDEVRHAVARVDGRAELEVSGNLDEDSVRAYAEALGEGGRLAVGAITHSAPQLDVALDMISTESRVLTRPASVVAGSSTFDAAPAAPVAQLFAPSSPTTEAEPATTAEPSSTGSSLWDAPTTPSVDVEVDAPSDVPAAEDIAIEDPSSGDEASSEDEPSVDASPDRDGDSAHDEVEDSPVVVVEPPKRRRISSFFSSDKDDTDTEIDAVPDPEPQVAADAPTEALASAEPDLAEAAVATQDLESSADEPAASTHALASSDAPATSGDVTDAPVEALASAAPAQVAAAVDVQDAPGEAEADDASEADEDPSIDEAAIADAEVEGEPFSWRQSPFRQRRNRD